MPIEAVTVAAAPRVTVAAVETLLTLASCVAPPGLPAAKVATLINGSLLESLSPDQEALEPVETSAARICAGVALAWPAL